jgi:acetyltransferase-like isoleucine patch superfamily enzyme
MTYTEEELRGLGITFGSNVLIDRSVRFFGNNISIGSNVRIDCHCVITAKQPVVIGSFCHLGVGVCLIGTAGVVIEDFAGLSPRATVFTTSDDFIDGYLTNPMVPTECRKVFAAPVTISRHAIVGAASVVLPGVTLGIGASVGAMSLVRKDLPPYSIATGNPLKVIGQRNASRLEELERKCRGALS